MKLYLNMELIWIIELIIECIFLFWTADTKVPAHRAVLVARCEVMAAMFSGSYMEANSILIPVYGISKDTFLAFLEYIYTDTFCPGKLYIMS